MIVKRIALDKHGLELFCGSLEATILSILWKADAPLTSAAIHRIYLKEYGVDGAFTTIDTTVRRMARKGMITAPTSYARRFTPAWACEDDFINACISVTLTTIWNEYPAYLDRSVIQ